MPRTPTVPLRVAPAPAGAKGQGPLRWARTDGHQRGTELTGVSEERTREGAGLRWPNPGRAGRAASRVFTLRDCDVLDRPY